MAERTCETCANFGIWCKGASADGFGCSIDDGLPQWEPKEEDDSEAESPEVKS